MSDLRSFPWLGLATLAVLILVAIIAAVGWNVTREPEPAVAEVSYIVPQESELSPDVTEPTDVSESFEIPVEPVAPAEPQPELRSEPKPVLPLLRESDGDVKQKINALPQGAALMALLVNDELIRKVARMVHGLSDGFLVKEFRPFISPQSRFSAIETGDQNKDGERIYRIGPDNSARYASYISALKKTPPNDAAALYHHYFPLLQQAYEELGLREPDFKKVTFKALDVLLADIPVSSNNDAPRLRQPSVMYIYDDTRLESANGVDKLKLRMGVENTRELQSWLREFRSALLTE